MIVVWCMVVDIPKSGLAKVENGTHKPLLMLTNAKIPEDGQRLDNKQWIVGRLPAPRGVECGVEDADYGSG